VPPRRPLVAVIGRLARNVSKADGWDHVAGLTVGQDLSERTGQLAGPSPQFSLAKSLPGFGPMGPWLVSPADLDDRDDLELACSINGEQMQKGRTRDLVFSVPAMVSALSRQLPLLPGDVLFTCTPAGVGIGRDPGAGSPPATSSSATSPASESSGSASSPPAPPANPYRTGSQQTREEVITMALHRLTSVMIGVPNVAETAAYYTEFGLTQRHDGWLVKHPRRGPAAADRALAHAPAGGAAHRS